jgi:hypothetical protein
MMVVPEPCVAVGMDQSEEADMALETPPNKASHPTRRGQQRIFLSIRALVVLQLILMAPRTASAYVDPGLVSTLAQGIFALFAGVISVWLLRPWTFIKSLFRRPRVDGQNAHLEASERNDSSG